MLSIRHGLAVRFGDAGLHGAQSAVADDHLRVRGPEPRQYAAVAGICAEAGRLLSGD